VLGIKCLWVVGILVIRRMRIRKEKENDMKSKLTEGSMMSLSSEVQRNDMKSE